MPLLDAVIATNLAQPARMLALLQRTFSELTGVRVAVLGLAFKEDTDDMRESPAIPIVRQLLERGATVTAYDPIATRNARARRCRTSVHLVDFARAGLARCRRADAGHALGRVPRSARAAEWHRTDACC